MDNRIPNFSAFVDYSSTKKVSEPINSNLNRGCEQQFQLATHKSSQQFDCQFNTSDLSSVPTVRSMTNRPDISQDKFCPIKTGNGDYLTATEGNQSADTTLCINNQTHKTTQTFKFEDREQFRCIPSCESRKGACTELQQVRPMIPSSEIEGCFYGPSMWEPVFSKPYEELYEEPNIINPRRLFNPYDEDSEIYHQTCRPFDEHYQSSTYQQNYNIKNGKKVESPCPNAPIKRRNYGYYEPQPQDPKQKIVQRQHISHQSYHGKNIPQDVEKISQTPPPNEINRQKSNASRLTTKAKPQEGPQYPSKRFPSWTDWMSSMYESLVGGDDSLDTSEDSQVGPMLLMGETSRYRTSSRKRTRPMKRSKPNGFHSSQDSKENVDTSERSHVGPMLLMGETSRYRTSSRKQTRPMKRGKPNGFHSSQDSKENVDTPRIYNNTPTFVFVKRAKIFIKDKQYQDTKSQNRSWDLSSGG